MATFEEREQDFENRFQHDQHLRFKVAARRNRMLGLWAAKKMGLADDAAEKYAEAVVETQVGGGDKGVIDKLVADITAKGSAVTVAQVKFELDHFAVTAKKQIMNE
jgi:hypothetical protein